MAYAACVTEIVMRGERDGLEYSDACRNLHRP
jgi:hypothetical protein